MIPAGYHVVETDVRVDVEPYAASRFRFLAKRARERHEARRRVPFYRFELVQEDGRWLVVAFQNVLERDPVLRDLGPGPGRDHG